MLSCDWTFARCPSPCWFFWCPLKCGIALCFSPWVNLTWSVDWNDVEAAMGAHMCIPCIPQPGFYVESDQKEARHSSQRWAGWSALLPPCPHPHRDGKEGSGWAWNILLRGWGELCCSAKKSSVPLREGAELCCQTCSRCQKRRAELLSLRLLWLCPLQLQGAPSFIVCTIFFSAQRPTQSELRAGAAGPESELCLHICALFWLKGCTC